MIFGFFSLWEYSVGGVKLWTRSSKLATNRILWTSLVRFVSVLFRSKIQKYRTIIERVPTRSGNPNMSEKEFQDTTANPELVFEWGTLLVSEYVVCVQVQSAEYYESAGTRSTCVFVFREYHHCNSVMQFPSVLSPRVTPSPRSVNVQAILLRLQCFTDQFLCCGIPSNIVQSL